MRKRSDYRARLLGLAEWEPFLLSESGLPGPRANLELVQAAADVGQLAQFQRWLASDAGEFLALCAGVGLDNWLPNVRPSVSLLDATDRQADDFRVLRQALAYGWSVAIVGAPDTGQALLERWLTSEDGDVAWMARQNLKKDRLKQLDPAWVERWSSR